MAEGGNPRNIEDDSVGANSPSKGSKVSGERPLKSEHEMYREECAVLY